MENAKRVLDSLKKVLDFDVEIAVDPITGVGFESWHKFSDYESLKIFLESVSTFSLVFTANNTRIIGSMTIFEGKVSGFKIVANDFIIVLAMFVASGALSHNEFTTRLDRFINIGV